MRPTPITALPPFYREVRHLVLTAPGNLLRLNLLSLIPLFASVLWMALWWGVMLQARGPWPGPALPLWLIAVSFLAVLPLHEGLHGLAIWLLGYRPRFGSKLRQGVLYATADDALFTRNGYLLVAAAPIVGITLLGMLLMLLVSDSAGYFVAWGVVINNSSSIGDLWVMAVVLRHPPTALIRDEADSIRVYEQVS